METFYQAPGYFSHAVSKIQGTLVELKKRLHNQFEKDVVTYIQNRITEINFQIYFSYLLNQTGIENIVVNDIDKIVRVGNEFKAIFELKTRRRVQNGFIRVPKSQWLTLRAISESLDIPVFYLIKLPYNYFKLVKLNFWRTEALKDVYYQYQDLYVKIPLKEGLTLNEDELIIAIMDILR